METLQNITTIPEIEEAIIFNIADRPVFMFYEDRFWVSLKTIWQWLGTIERAFLLSGETIIFLNDKDAGNYILVDDLLSVCPREIQTVLNTQKNKCLVMMDGEK